MRIKADKNGSKKPKNMDVSENSIILLQFTNILIRFQLIFISLSSCTQNMIHLSTHTSLNHPRDASTDLQIFYTSYTHPMYNTCAILLELYTLLNIYPNTHPTENDFALIVHYLKQFLIFDSVSNHRNSEIFKNFSKCFKLLGICSLIIKMGKMIEQKKKKKKCN